MSIGGNNTEIALYPGGAWASTILLSTLCDNTTDISSIYSGNQAGLFDTTRSSTYDDTYIFDEYAGDWSSMQFGYTNAVPINAERYQALDSIDVGGTVVRSVDLLIIP